MFHFETRELPEEIPPELISRSRQVISEQESREEKALASLNQQLKSLHKRHDDEIKTLCTAPQYMLYRKACKRRAKLIWTLRLKLGEPGARAQLQNERQAFIANSRKLFAREGINIKKLKLLQASFYRKLTEAYVKFLGVRFDPKARGPEA
jgi:hypothetical protein